MSRDTVIYEARDPNHPFVAPVMENSFEARVHLSVALRRRGETLALGSVRSPASMVQAGRQSLAERVA